MSFSELPLDLLSLTLGLAGDFVGFACQDASNISTNQDRHASDAGL